MRRYDHNDSMAVSLYCCTQLLGMQFTNYIKLYKLHVLDKEAAVPSHCVHSVHVTALCM